MDAKPVAIKDISVPCENERIGEMFALIDVRMEDWITALGDALIGARAAIEHPRIAPVDAAPAATNSAADAVTATEPATEAATKPLKLPRSSSKRKTRKRQQQEQPAEAPPVQDAATAAEQVAPDMADAHAPVMPTSISEPVDPAMLDRFATESELIKPASSDDESDNDRLLAQLDPKIAKQVRIKCRLTGKSVRSLLDEMGHAP